MNKIAAIILSFALIPGISSAAQRVGTAFAPSSTETFAQTAHSYVYVMSGDVFASQGKNPAHRVSDREVITSDTLINTSDNSTALLRFADGQVVTMQANSSFHVREYRYDARRIKNSSIVFSILKGGMHFVTGKIGKQNKQAFRLLTPNVTINVRGTDFMVAMVGDSVYSHVVNGKIRMTNAAGTSLIGAGQSAVATSSGSPVSLVSASALPSDTFSKLFPIPVLASVIPARAPKPVETRAMKSEMAPAKALGSRIYVVKGDVSVTQGKKPAHQVVEYESIVPDTLVNTGENSAALLKFEDGQVVTMKPNSTFHVREYNYNAKQVEKSNIVFSMFKGGMRFITGKIAKRRKQSFRLLTPNATIGIRGTEFMAAIVDKSVYTQVASGGIVVTNAAGMGVVSAGQAATVPTSSTPVSLVAPSTIPAEAFDGLPSIPVDPSAIPAPAAAVPGAPALAGASALIAAAVPEDEPEPEPEPEPESAKEESRSGIGLTGKIGTLGYGAEMSFGSSDSFSTRVGLNAFNHTSTGTTNAVNYDIKYQLQTASVLVDWYPFEGRFRTSAGLLYNNNEFTFNGKPTSEKYTINSIDYPAAQIGSLQGKVAFNKVAPYLGIGWGNPVANGKGWGMTSDFGVMFQGSPKTNLTVVCGTGLSAGLCGALQAEVAAENIKFQEDVKDLKLWPVVSLGISYQW